MDERVKRETVQTEKKQRSAKSATANEQAAEKKRFREAALAARDSLTTKQRRDYSEMIIKNLTTLSCYQDAAAILTYISFRSEVDTFHLLKRAFTDKKAVFAPKVMGKEMAFYRIFSVDDLSTGYRGILEPAKGQLFAEWRADCMSQCALICLPGAAFDRACHRIGYGGGFYDRYLEGLQQGGEHVNAEACLQADTDAAKQLRMKCMTVALAYSCQIFDEIPWETHDIRPEQIITETEIIG